MVFSRGPRTPSGFHAAISFGAGAAVPIFVKPLEFLLLLGLWVAILVFMHVRARAARGIFIDEEVGLFTWLGLAAFFAGLLFVATTLAVFM